MINHYLYISERNDELIDISSSDGVFSSFATVKKEQFDSYCDKKAKEWKESTLGNYDKFNKEQHNIIANKWINAKKLPIGNYDYYFTFGDIKDIFREEVNLLAKNLGITSFTLEIS